VRRAIAHAINRANLQQAFGGAAINPALTHVLPSTVLGSQPVFDLYPFDADLARSILNEAGHAEGLELKLLYTKGFDAMTKAFQVVQQDLSKIGIKVTGIAVPSADLFTEYLTVPDVASRGVWDLAFSGWAADWFGNSALSFFRPLFSGEPSFPPNGSNFGFYDSPITNDLIERAIAAKDDETSSELWHQADEQTMKDVAVYPTTQPFQANYHAEQVHNAVYVPMLQNFDPTNVWLDPAANGG
jgi:peptide/nickel transport system substrate-binding protein